MPTGLQGHLHLIPRTPPDRTTQGRRHLRAASSTAQAPGGARGLTPVAPGTQARGFVLYVGLDECAVLAAGTSLTRLANQLRRYIESLVPGSQTAAAVVIAPAAAPGTDLEVVHRVLGDPSTRQGPGPESVQAPAPASPDRPGALIDFPRRQVQLDGQPLKLTNKEFELLAYLVEHRERTVPRPELINALWTDGEEVPNERTIDAHIRRLRTKLGRLAGTVRTVRGQGYRFSEHPDVVIQPARQRGGR